MIHLTSDHLKSLKPCQDGLKNFLKAFPNGAKAHSLSEAIRLAKANPQLDYKWAAERLLKAPAWAAYKEAEASAWAAYEEAEAVAFITAYWNQEENKG